MTSPMAPADVAELVRKVIYPIWAKERDRLKRIDKWLRWEHELPYAPKASSAEYKMLMAKSSTPWLALVVSTASQQLYVDGYRSGGSGVNAKPWDYWQRNRMDSRQIAAHRAALGSGLCYTKVLPGKPVPVIRCVSPRKMIALYQDEVEDDYPMYALQVDEQPGGKISMEFIDDQDVHRLSADRDGSKVEYIDYSHHGIGLCPVIRIADQLDLDGRSPGQVEPFIPTAARIDQTTFDRLIVQRYASWKVRTISGMALPDEEDKQNHAKLKLMVNDILIAEDADTRFGTLPETPLTGFIEARVSDIRDLAAVTQIPLNNFLGQMINLSAEALAAAEASLNRKLEERKVSFGESWEQVLQLAALVDGDLKAADDFHASVRWRDMESRSLAQVADALGKIATMLGVPVQMLWEKIPGFTDDDVEEAKRLKALEPNPMQQIADVVSRGSGAASAGNAAGG